MADRTIKPDDTHDLVLQNNHGDSKIEINENDTIVVTSEGASAGLETSTKTKIKQKAAFMQSSTHQVLALGY